jgi:hypothetical protein
MPTSNAAKVRPRDPAKWDTLKPDYRRRLERNGITRSSYARGVSLTQARRGEAPERPSVARKHPERFPNYKTTIRAIVKDGDSSRIVDIAGLNKRDRQQIAKHWNAVFDYLEYKHPKGYISPFRKRKLSSFAGKTYNGYELETREDKLDELAIRVDLAFEDFYPKVK